MDWPIPKELKSQDSIDSDDSDDDGVYADDDMMRLDLLEGYEDHENISFEIETGSEGMSEADQNRFAEEEMCVVFICGDKASVPHQVGFHR